MVGHGGRYHHPKTNICHWQYPRTGPGRKGLSNGKCTDRVPPIPKILELEKKNEIVITVFAVHHCTGGTLISVLRYLRVTKTAKLLTFSELPL